MIGRVALLGVLIAAAAPAAELLYVSEGNRLRVLDVASLDAPPLRQRILVENAKEGGARGRDINGMVCPLPDGSGRLLVSEDTGQPHTPGGYAVLSPDGRQLAKLTPSSYAKQPEPFGCAFDREGRLFTSELGDPGFFGGGNGQLLLWFPPYEGFPGPPGAYPDTDADSPNYCKLATDIGTAVGVATDADGRVYVASSSGMKILRFSPPFPRGPDAAGGCGRRDALGSPLADRVQRETFVRTRPLSGLFTYAGLAIAPNGNLYASSVITGRIAEFDLDGRLVRLVLRPSGWLPPFATGTPFGLAVDRNGTLYYADLDLVRSGWGMRPGADGKVWRIRFDAGGEPLAPEPVLNGLAFPDGLGISPSPPY